MATEKKQKALSDWAPQGGAPLLPLAGPVNMAGERTGPLAPPPPAGKPVVPLLIGVVLGAAATGVTLSVVSPTVVPEPIVIVSASGAPVAPSAIQAPKPVAVAPVAKPVAAAAPTPSPRPAEKVKEKEKPAENDKGAAVSAMFAKVAIDPSAPVELTQEQINEVIAAHRPATGACAEAQRTAAPDTSGTLTVKWNIEHEGRVNNVQAIGDLAETDFAACLVKEIRGWTFPKHDTPHPPVQASFKF